MSNLPPLPHAPDLDIDGGDVTLPRIKIAQFSSKQVQSGLVKPGQIYSSTSEEDATVLYDPEDTKAKGVLVYVLGMTKGKSVSIDGSLERFAFNDPSAPADAWVTYDYSLALPEEDAELPYKWLMTKSAAPAAKSINLVLKKGQASGPAWNSAFRITTKSKKNEKGTYYVPVVQVIAADKKFIESSGTLAGMIAGPAPVAALPSGGDEPAI